MRRAAERGAFHRRAGRVQRIELDDPAEAVRLVRVLHRVEAIVVLMPAVTPAALPQAPALFVCRQVVAAGEIADEVFFARQVGAPRRLAAGAVVQRAEHGAAFGVGRGFHHRVAGARPADGKRRIAGAAARVARRPHHLPGAALHLDLEHREAVRGLRFLHLLSRPRHEPAFVQQAVVGVLVVHRQQAARIAIAIERIEVDAVVVHAHLRRLLGARMRCIAAPGRHVAGNAYRLAPGGEGRRDITLGHHQRVGGHGRHGLEADHRHHRLGRFARRRGGAARHQRRIQRARRQAHAAAQHGAPRRVAHVVDARVGRAVAVLHRVEILARHRYSSICVIDDWSVPA